MKINLQVKTEHYIKQLSKKGVQLQQTAADTVNESAEDMRKEYNLLLNRKSTVRTKFTTNATKVFKSRPISSTGKPRPLNNINAKVVVRNMKGGEHYLAKREKTERLRGNPLTMGRVPVPLVSSRTSQSDLKPISSGNRILKTKTQTLRLNGKKIGVKGDGYKTSSSRWRAVYQGMGRGKKQKITGNLNKPFYMFDKDGDLGIFKRINKRILKIRNLDKKSTTRKGKPDFKRSFKNIKPSDLQRSFVKKAEKILS